MYAALADRKCIDCGLASVGLRCRYCKGRAMQGRPHPAGSRPRTPTQKERHARFVRSAVKRPWHGETIRVVICKHCDHKNLSPEPGAKCANCRRPLVR